jgi:diphosphomevalonate decarboxylase
VSEKTIRVRAPSNIALIKYMGKKESTRNIPENPSVSLTLNSLCTLAEITVSRSENASVRLLSEAPRFRPESLAPEFDLMVPKLGDHGTARALHHFERVKKAIPEIFPRFGLSIADDAKMNSTYSLRTANTFPASSGIASSASSFAAITLATAAACAQDFSAFEKAWDQDFALRRALARVSRQGSGSSCRSFEGPWVLWEREDAAAVQTKMPEMAHFVVLVRTLPKKVSSSSAHSMVRTSPLWDARVARVENRTRLMMAALDEVDFASLARITWSESWEMHSLFHTCAEPFSYWEPGTIDALQWLAPMISEPSPPLVTLDAGPNIHILVEKRYRDQWRARLKEHFTDTVILEDEQGYGAQLEGIE